VLGEEITYTIRVHNTGNVTMHSVEVTDDMIPQGASYISGDDNNDNLLQPGEIWVYAATYNIQRTDIDAGMVDNIATVSGLCPANSEITASDNVVIFYVELASPELSITKISSKYDVLPGDTITFSIEVVNSGNQNAFGVMLTDVLSQHFEYISSTHSGSYHSESRTVEWMLNEITTVEMVTVEVVVVINSDCIPGTELFNMAVAESSTIPDAVMSNEVQLLVGTSADLVIFKTSDTEKILPGGNLTYYLTVINHGPTFAGQVVITDHLPSDAVFKSANKGGIYHADNHKVEWTIDTLYMGETIEVEVYVELIEEVPAERNIMNLASVDSDTHDPDMSNNLSVHSLKVSEPQADLVISKSTNKTTVIPGEEIEYNIVLTNNGPEPAIQVVITDVLSNHFSFIETNENGVYSPSNHSVNWTFLQIPAGHTINIRLKVMVNADTPGDIQITNIATVSAQTQDPDPSNNSGSATIGVEFPELFIPNMFSPNADGINDLFVIRGLQKYPNNSLIIINRWGNKVFEADPYNNDWDGTTQFGPTIGGNELPIGTYYYILYLEGTDSKPTRGFIYLSR
jgi:large repetitive protein